MPTKHQQFTSLIFVGISHLSSNHVNQQQVHHLVFPSLPKAGPKHTTMNSISMVPHGKKKTGKKERGWTCTQVCILTMWVYMCTIHLLQYVKFRICIYVIYYYILLYIITYYYILLHIIIYHYILLYLIIFHYILLYNMCVMCACPHIISNTLHGRFDLIEMLHPR